MGYLQGPAHHVGFQRAQIFRAVGAMPDIASHTEYPLGEDSSMQLKLFDSLLRAKPYPAELPFATEPFLVNAAGAPLEGSELPLRPRPSAAAASLLRRVHSAQLQDEKARPHVLELSLDGESTLATAKGLPQKKPAAQLKLSQLHLGAASFAAAKKAYPRSSHSVLPTPDAPWPLPDANFDAVVCHGCLPFLTDPLFFFGELYRVLKPSGSAVVSWFDAFCGEGDGAAAAYDAEHATAAWASSADAAELLYMTASFFKYSGAWQRLRIESADDRQRELFFMTGVKMTDRELQLLRAKQDIVRRLAEAERNALPISHSTSSFPRQKYAWPAASQSAPIKPSLKRHGFAMPAPAAQRDTPAPPPPKAEAQRPVAEEEPRGDAVQRREERPAATQAPSAQPPAPSSQPPASAGAVLPPRLQPLGSGAFSRPPPQEAAPEQKQRLGRPGEEETALPSPAKPAPGMLSNATARPTAEGATAAANAQGATVDQEESWRKSELVRAKILETMKRGISQAKNRTDLGAGELQLLDHMKMYVMETKLAEANLTADESAIWEELKADYVTSSTSKRNDNGA